MSEAVCADDTSVVSLRTRGSEVVFSVWAKGLIRDVGRSFPFDPFSHSLCDHDDGDLIAAMLAVTQDLRGTADFEPCRVDFW